MKNDICRKCGRARPDCIADPSCSKGGYCEWVPVPQESALLMAETLLQQFDQQARARMQSESAREREIVAYEKIAEALAGIETKLVATFERIAAALERLNGRP